MLNACWLSVGNGFSWALKAQKRLHNTVKGPRKLKDPGLTPLQLGVDEGRVYWGQTSHSSNISFTTRETALTNANVKPTSCVTGSLGAVSRFLLIAEIL